MRTLFLFLLLFHASAAACAEEFFGRVIAVLDGDTVLVARGTGQPVKVRLAGIDAPERAQEYGLESRKSLQEMVMRKQVHVRGKAVDDYGRLVAEISVDGLNINHEQVRRGMAWDFSRFQGNRELLALQREARQARRGLWAGEPVIEPSQWRKQHPPVPASSPAPAVVSNSACSKKRCAEMSSCEEAKYYLAHCHARTIDGDGDGIPCERLCAARQ